MMMYTDASTGKFSSADFCNPPLYVNYTFVRDWLSGVGHNSGLSMADLNSFGGLLPFHYHQANAQDEFACYQQSYKLQHCQ